MESLDHLNMNMRRNFKDRAALIAYITEEFTAAAHRNTDIPQTRGGRTAALAQLNRIDPALYGSTRNYLDGAVSRLSPYLRHGVLSLAEVRDRALTLTSPQKAEKFVNELCWRDYWQKVYTVIGGGIWHNIEPYKTGFSHDDYADDLPEDIRNGETPSPCINTIIRELYTTGYLHNRLRMYLAAYVVHWRRIKWQTGAAWFLEHLLDGDPASNNLSWQWVASTFGSKPYIFNKSNMDKYLEKFGDCGHREPDFNGSYEEIAARLFPNGQGSTGHADNDYKQRLKKVTFVDPKAEGDFENPIVWIHGDNMNPTNPALTLYPHAPAIWVWDDALLDDYNIALKRILFMYENLLEMPENLAIRRGNVYTELTRFADEHSADGIIVMNSPSPRFNGLVNKLDKQIPVKIMLEQPIVTHPGPYDLRRFSRYWRTAQKYAFD